MHLLTREEIDAIPDLEPMIDGVLDKGTVAMLAAQPGAGKSFLALDWACRYATGLRWQGRDVNRMMQYPTGNQGPGKVLYIAAEGARGIKTRLAAWEHAWDTHVPNTNCACLTSQSTSATSTRYPCSSQKWKSKARSV